MDWNRFKHIVQGLYDNRGPKGDRPNLGPVIIIKVLALQAWYGLSDPGLQRQLDEKGLTVRKGVLQNSSFITADSGRARADKPRGKEARHGGVEMMLEFRRAAYLFLGTRLHMKIDLGHGLIRGLRGDFRECS